MTETLLTTAELAGMLRKPVATVYMWNHKGTGPRRIRVGREVRYRLSDVETWLEANTVEVGDEA